MLTSADVGLYDSRGSLLLCLALSMAEAMPASDNHGGVADLSVLWLLIKTCLSQSKCV